ncbi:MAG: single-stranded-DNA-specific exonuclease RecJ [Clostridia bacterium]|jgi:single-stranded-DNA-specific exonuclease|nr:single-stranded-DNA-specific exonuclease RecJ [Clostridia bacterium]
MNKKWEINEENKEQIEEFAKENNLSLLLSSVLLNRGICKKEEVEIFLNPTRDNFHNPFLMPDMEKAVLRILKAIETKEKVLIYGDYDADGITSITVMKKFLAQRGLEVGYYIPNRLNEGYGLNKTAIDTIQKQGYTLMITVDCGISGIEEIRYAMELGIEVIVTDHHEPGEEIPKCLAVIDAKRKDNQYPFNQLAGVGVVFKVIQAISIQLKLDPKEYLKYLDIVCVGTISDIVPLVDENRVIAKLGLKLVSMTKNVGLRTLLTSIGYHQVDSTAISFGVAPRINACGRMGEEKEALKLFLTENIQEAREITAKLNEYNISRQTTEKQIFSQAVEQIEKEGQKEEACIVLGSEQWHHGVIGIVASKVTDIYFKPSILICFEGEEGKGSGRSIPGFDLHEALMNCSTNIERFGGHSMAIGITVKKEKFESFKKEFEEYTKNSSIRDIIPIIKIDKQVELKQINLEMVKDLKLLEPYGEANKVPLFLMQNLKIQAIRSLSEGKHLKLKLGQDNYLIDAIGFNMGEYVGKCQIGDKVDIVGSLEINSFNGNDQIQMNLKDIRMSL